MPTLFSVFIPIRNDARWLTRAVESVLAQSCSDFELIVGDNASNDDPQAVLEKFDDPRIRFHRFDESVDVVASFNRTTALCTGDWLVPMGADDRLEPDALTTFADTIRGRDDLAMVVGRCARVDEEGNPAGAVWRFYQGRIPVEAGDYDTHAWIRVVSSEGQPPWNIGSIALRRNAIERSGGLFNPEAGPGSDTELMLRMGGLGSVHYTDECLLTCTERPSSDQRGQWLANRTSDDEETIMGRAYRAGLSSLESTSGPLSRDERALILDAVARTYVQRAAHHRLLDGGMGRAGARKDVQRAWRTSRRAVLNPHQLAYSAAAILAPTWMLNFASRVLRQERA